MRPPRMNSIDVAVVGTTSTHLIHKATVVKNNIIINTFAR